MESKRVDDRAARLDNWRGVKCEPGYIHRQKIFQSCMLLVFIAIGVGLFLIGMWITKTRANVFTVLGILMVLPAAKRVIAIVVMLPRRSVEQERCDRMREVLPPGAVLLTDYVFTSLDKVMCLDFVVVCDKWVAGVCPGGSRVIQKKTVDYMEEYLQGRVSDVASDYRVELFDSDEAFFERVAVDGKTGTGMGEEKAGEQGEEAGTEQDEVVKMLKVLAV